MTVKILPANGPITINFPLLNGVTKVGPDPVLADNSDATYVDGNPDALDYMAQLASLSSYAPGDPISLHLRILLSSDDGSGEQGDVFIFLQDGHPTNISGTYYVGQFANAAWNHAARVPPPYDGTIRDVVWPLVLRPGFTVSDCVAVLMSGTAQLAFNSIEIRDAGPLYTRVFEAWVQVGDDTVTQPAPCRRYPRAQGHRFRGVSDGPRIWPPDTVRR